MPQLAFAAAVGESITRSSDAKGTDAETPTETPEPDTTPSETTPPETKATEKPNETEPGSSTEPNTGTVSQTESTGGAGDTGSTETEPQTETDKNGSGIKADEETDSTIKKPDDGLKEEDHSDANANLTTNIIAGNGVYLEQLQGTYNLQFEDGFESIMNEIEADYKDWLDHPDQFVATNWQQVLAVYVLQYKQEHGNGAIVMDASSKPELEKVFFLMNIRSTSSMANKLSGDVDHSKETYPMTVKDYEELRNLDANSKEILDKYTSDDCKLLCAMITASKGFVREEVGPDVSEERIAIVSAACSLIGKVGYFWGGKSYAIGWDNLWGNPMTITSAGSKSTGTSRGFGLDCSGFVCWSYFNGLNGSDGGIGNHTSTQWNASTMVDSATAKPGDMVFYNSPAAGDQNHIGDGSSAWRNVPDVSMVADFLFIISGDFPTAARPLKAMLVPPGKLLPFGKLSP